MTTARQENARTLAAAIGMVEAQAEVLLDAQVLVTFGPTGAPLADLIHKILSRTLSNVVTRPRESPPAVELVIGKAVPRSQAPIIGVSVDQYKLEVRDGRVDRDVYGPRIVELLAACYASAAAVQRALPVEFPIPLRLPIEVDLDVLLGEHASVLAGPIELGTAYLAGAGAIGNGFLLGLSTLTFVESYTCAILTPQAQEISIAATGSPQPTWA